MYELAINIIKNVKLKGNLVFEEVRTNWTIYALEKGIILMKMWKH